MIRAIAIAALTLLLVFVPYLPAANPPGRFLAQVRIEHGLQTRLWGEDRAERIMERALAMNGALSSASPIPSDSQAPDTGRMKQAAAREMEQVNLRFFGNAYFRAIDALLFLATYRLAALMEWLPVEGFVMLALIADGLITRILRSKEFKPHDPEWFALHTSAFILLVCASIVAFTVPVSIFPSVLAGLPVAGVFFIGRAAASFHRSR
ncbi:MAG: DUF4400 domain-containing protein [Desulfovibrionaceae bacterium]|nr:DUF4400 domain-containing protein [Desulfovibrionaceae bacterium]